VNRAIALPPAVLVVAHGALFRALRTAMGIEPLIRTPNAVPIWCEPPAAGETAWKLDYSG
jgi:probable phosphoglycerate mutase